jgi:mannosyl-oligosaccharide alpha-1,2-mannosidase
LETRDISFGKFSFVCLEGILISSSPEALESVFYMHRITGDPKWRTAGWQMTSSILKATRTTFGHASIQDVNSLETEYADEMESFWLAETLKYAFLLFDEEDRYSLDDWVLTTEAHLFKRPAKA